MIAQHAPDERLGGLSEEEYALELENTLNGAASKDPAYIVRDLKNNRTAIYTSSGQSLIVNGDKIVRSTVIDGGFNEFLKLR